MQTHISSLNSRLRDVPGSTSYGKVAHITGMSLVASGLETSVGIGERCFVRGKRGDVLSEVVGTSEHGIVLLPFGAWDGIGIGDQVRTATDGDVIYPCEGWIGRVVNALGVPVDGGGSLQQGRHSRFFKGEPLNAFARKRVGPKMDTAIKSMDVFTPVCRGQRLGIFAGSGVGKSSMMSMLTRNATADVIVIGLVGERGREVQDFIQDDLGEEGMAKSVLVVSTGDEPPLMRRQAAWTATTVAEYFRDQGKHVLLLLDSVTRFAMAQREIGLSAGEPPTTKGYPPTVFSELPKLLERAGPGPADDGDITGIFTVLVDGDDHNEPISDTVRGITDGHIVLDRRIAEGGRYPAINLLKSVSRMLPDCHNDIELRIMNEARALISRYEDMEEIIRVGAYKQGTDPVVDAAILFSDKIKAFLSQRKHEAMASDEAFAHIYQMLGEVGVEIPVEAYQDAEG
ncbi:flagellar protein export ATPase FliI [Salipiger mucosus]|uniref:Flagellum-specific ATP synthase n=1 Tax=Salipiger mucosus DSM 16094 TaxID=1123237 RepID=S9Q9E6_9RHOB|nr:flagellar protein export ATPase FliI [Salipiger mucosus]EPX77996.1 Flagellum-specific ATP synthase FliI [Salipiger mucosus DSM 16094]